MLRFSSVQKFKLAALLTLVCVVSSTVSLDGFAQKRRTRTKTGSHTSVTRPTMTAAARASLEEAIGVVCNQAKLDPQGSSAIDDMQARPSLPLDSPQAQDGAARATRVLPAAKDLVVRSLRQLAVEYNLKSSPLFANHLEQAITRVQNVRRIRPDMDVRDNASVYLSRPHTITFGTIFLAGLQSDEGMISVLAHELTHIADGYNDGLRPLVTLVAGKASMLTGLDIRGQRAEELTCDLIGVMAVRSYVSDSPDYESIARRLSRSIEHNCVDVDEGDDEHLSPRNTMRALLALTPVLMRELINDREERPAVKSNP